MQDLFLHQRSKAIRPFEKKEKKPLTPHSLEMYKKLDLLHHENYTSEVLFLLQIDDCY